MRELTTGPEATSGSPLTPRQIVQELDRFIVGQAAAKRCVAIAIRNRWRRQQLAEDLRHEISPKNIMMIGPTGVGKTEIARRLAKMTGAPFIKVEATKYTEVGYYGRDVESMVRELVENAIGIVRDRERKKVASMAEERVEERLLDMLVPESPDKQQDDHENEDDDREESPRKRKPKEDDKYSRTREKFREMLRDRKLEEKKVELRVEHKATPVVFSGMGMEHMDVDLQGMFEKILPRHTVHRQLTVAEARKVLFEQECDALLEPDKINGAAIDLAENLGIIFLDEVDKIVASEGKGADVSRQGVQRDLLPIVEGTTVQTRYGYIRTDHVLFIAAGAFHKAKPADLMPELQGRFPLRVELTDLTKEDFIRILKEPQNSLTRQYVALMGTEGMTLEFTDDGIDAMAAHAFKVNRSTQNIGARRLFTILEKVVEDLSFDAPDATEKNIRIDAAYVNSRLSPVTDDEDLSKFIL